MAFCARMISNFVQKIVNNIAVTSNVTRLSGKNLTACPTRNINTAASPNQATAGPITGNGLFKNFMQNAYPSVTGTQQQVRTRISVTYRPNAKKRIRKHGLQKHLKTRRGVCMLWRKYLKNRWVLAIDKKAY